MGIKLNPDNIKNKEGKLNPHRISNNDDYEKRKAFKVLKEAKRQEKEIKPPKGYKFKWVKGPLRSMVRKLVKIGK